AELFEAGSPLAKITTLRPKDYSEARTIGERFRDWHPKGLTVVVLEVIMTVTDPPVKLLRRLIPQLTIGAVRYDLSIMVLLLAAFIGMQVAFNAAM
ncbi:YggT family protein, partial [Streptomyces asiaticus]|uniref:YggT family protein n=1 Tax=Streptomyces asiaticus TaxID=114695 RepID=UPI003F662635